MIVVNNKSTPRGLPPDKYVPLSSSLHTHTHTYYIYIINYILNPIQRVTKLMREMPNPGDGGTTSTCQASNTCRPTIG